ncbi:MAG: sugar transferase [Phormidesmis sp.]
MKLKTVRYQNNASSSDIRATGRAGAQIQYLRWLSVRSCSLILSDVVALAMAWRFARSLNHFYSPIPEGLLWWVWLDLPSPFWIFTLVTLLTFSYFGLYRHAHRTKNYAKAGQLVSRVYILFLVCTYFYDPHLDLPRSLFFTAWASSIVLIVISRIVANVLLFQFDIDRKPISVFLVANPNRLRSLSQLLDKRSHSRIIGVAIATTANSAITFDSILKLNPDEVLAESLPNVELASSLFWRLRSAGIPLRLLPSSREMTYRRGIPEVFSTLPTLRVESSFFPGWDYRIKRALDIVIAGIGSVFCIPLFIVIAIAIKSTSPGPIFFRQERVGLHGGVFHVWKFRTMVTNAPQLQQALEIQSKNDVLFKLHNDPRIIPVGHFLRKTSLDELPQLFNVLLGQMSLVGPRPLPIRDIARFEPWHHIRHQVLPGITGLWQISGRSDIDDFDDAARLDLHYIDNWSLNLDLEILLETIKIVCLGKGAY